VNELSRKRLKLTEKQITHNHTKYNSLQDDIILDFEQ